MPAVMLIVDQRPVSAVRAGIAYIFFNLSFYHGYLFKIRMNLGQNHRPACHPAIHSNRFVIYDFQHLGPQCPLGAETLRGKSEISAMHAQGIVVGIRKFRKLFYLFMLQSCHSHEKRIEIGHHKRFVQGAVKYRLAQKADQIPFACPEYVVILKQPVPGKARGSVGVEGFIQAIAPYAQNIFFTIYNIADRHIKFHGTYCSLLACRTAKSGSFFQQFFGGIPIYKLCLFVDFPPALKDHFHAKVLPDALNALLFPPEKSFKNFRLHPLSRAILKNQETSTFLHGLL